MTEELPKGHYWHGCNSCGNEWHSKNTKMERCPKCKKVSCCFVFPLKSDL